jgi:hypothetical protein
VSYKEDSDDDKTGSEDLVEVEWNETETPAEPDNAETIEKILSYRRGKKGGNEIILKCIPFECGLLLQLKAINCNSKC